MQLTIKACAWCVWQGRAGLTSLQKSAGATWKASWKRGVLASSERETQALWTREGRLKTGPGVPVRADASGHPFCPPTILPAAPCGQQLCSTRLCSTSLSSAPGRPPPPCPPPSPLLPLSPLTDHSLEGVGTPGLDTPHRGPRAQLIGRSHGRTQDPGAPRWAVCQGPSQLPQGQCLPGMQPPQGP